MRLLRFGFVQRANELWNPRRGVVAAFLCNPPMVEVGDRVRLSPEVSMSTDRYTRIVLTIIAACFIVLALRSLEPTVKAKGGFTSCTGDLKANAWGGIKETLGGYKVDIRCD